MRRFRKNPSIEDIENMRIIDASNWGRVKDPRTKRYYLVATSGYPDDEFNIGEIQLYLEWRRGEDIEGILEDTNCPDAIQEQLASKGAPGFIYRVTSSLLDDDIPRKKGFGEILYLEAFRHLAGELGSDILFIADECEGPDSTSEEAQGLWRKLMHLQGMRYPFTWYEAFTPRSNPYPLFEDMNVYNHAARWNPSKRSPDVAVAVLMYRGRALILQRGSTAPWMPNFWNLPGGGVDEGESPLIAAIRETSEEAGILVSGESAESLGIYDAGTWLLEAFVIEVEDPYPLMPWINSKRERAARIPIDPHLGFAENTDYAWVGAVDLGRYDFVPFVREILESVLYRS